MLKSALATAGAVALSSGAVLQNMGRAAAERVSQTTLAKRLVPGPAGPNGYRTIVAAAGEAHTVRTDLGAKAGSKRTAKRTAVAAFAHLSDVHIVDHQSPMRVEWADRFEDPPEMIEGLVPGLFSSAYRPQEILTAQVADSMVQAINAIKTGPVTSLPLQFAIETGDNSDNCQYNEIRWNIEVLDGGLVHPDSGNLNRYEGVMASDPLYYDPHYWHPEGTPSGQPDDSPRERHGFPEIPGLIDAARRPFQAHGLAMEWYSVFGNHDGLVQGNFPTLAPFNLIAIGLLKVVSLPAGVSQQDVINGLTQGRIADFLQRLLQLPGARPVTPDPNRRLLTRKQAVSEYFTTSGTPVGHGFTEENRRDGTAYYYFDKGDMRYIAMDSVNPNGYADGSLDTPQFAWLKSVIEQSDDKAIILFSHHTSGTMNNPLIATGADLSPRIMGDKLVEYLLTQPNVIAWFNGHTHANQIWAHTRDDGSGGFWEINTAAHIDFPQQSRLVEIVNNHDKTMSIFTTMIDHAAPAQFDGNLDSPLSLAALSRELSANDWQGSADRRSGSPEDRNVELLIATPPALLDAATEDPGDTTDPDDPSEGPAPSDPKPPSEQIGSPIPVGADELGEDAFGDFLPQTGGPDVRMLIGAAAAAVAGGEVVRRTATERKAPADAGADT